MHHDHAAELARRHQERARAAAEAERRALQARRDRERDERRTRAGVREPERYGPAA